MLSLPFLALGAAAWSFTEYGLHRFAGHGPKRKKGGLLSLLTPQGIAAAFQEEHIRHHADPMYFAPTTKKVLIALVAAPAAAAFASLVVGPRRGLSFGLGFAGTYLAYEIIHRRVHTHPPESAYMRWVDRNHLHHHVAPKVNHGVTSPVWDLVFRTQVPVPGPVKLHTKIAPDWMKGDDGKVRPEHARDFEVVGV